MNLMQLQNKSTEQLKNMTKKLFFITTMTFSFQCMAIENLQIVDKGQDGNNRYYSVACPDGTTSSVVISFKEINAIEVSEEVRKTRTGIKKGPKPQITNICASPGEKEKCNASWDIQTAAKQSCK